MVYIEADFDLNIKNMEAVDNWFEKKPECVKSIRILIPEELKIFNP